ncbi:SusC/RagA family TonB-linked outer membrane protein [Bacteroides sp. 519]|uniref:SusC/RagA family TonB-linked outer membrane protein n=1 Tax=Bacteroides sp. 519 TaxID=2302937 RepID=UPI0013D761C0|nr:SusC/RagA family TonB-linked outer membrane protein [Bacteroides sp. 519]NDV57521.1 SusC/RagA family TonB-linked outer membrane protein [Bacteroides sp. 519]
MSNFKRLLIFVVFLSSISIAFAQITLQVSNKPLKDVVKDIEKQTSYRFFYNNDLKGMESPVTLSVRNEKIEQVMDRIITQAPVTYAIKEHQVILSVSELLPQTKKITGKITDRTGEPIIGANVTVKGNTAIGTITDINGAYNIEVPLKCSLLISYIGYKPVEINVAGGNTFNVQMNDDSELLNEVVVTALGIKREEKALGYAVQKVNGDNLNGFKGVNMATTLTGQVAGLNIKNSTEFNQVPAISLRGETPLLVVDGVPYQNMTLREIASDDIESIDVLKGATASALYGARGGTGAIMITTKRAKEEGLHVTVNSSTLFNAGYLKFPDVQTAYSSGGGGHYGVGDYVWGDKLDIGRTAEQYNPITHEWEDMPLVSKGKNNLKNFQEFSFTTNNNVSISQKGKYGSVRASLTHVYNKDQFPNKKLNKFTYTVSGEMKYKKFSFEGGASYNKHFYPNDFGAGYGGGGLLYNLVVWTGTEIDIRDYKDYWVKENEVQNWMDNNYYDNPYFILHEIKRSSHYDIMNAYFNTSYDITPWLKATIRSGIDSYTKKEEWRNPVGASGGWSRNGYYGFRRTSGYSINNDAMLIADKTFRDFSVNGMFGGSIYFYENDAILAETQNGLTIPGLYSLNASVDPVKTGKNYYRKRMNSLYGKVSLGWKGMLYLDVTGRNDWSSTLDRSARSYFYPSVAGSVVMSEILPLPQVIGFWKIRASWTQTKEDNSVYANNNTYSVHTNHWEGMNSSAYPTILREAIIRPSATRSWEIGTNFSFFNNRLRTDITYYNKLYYNQIRNASVSQASGFSQSQINIEEERIRKGWEITLSGDIIRNDKLTWNAMLNWSRDRHYYNKIDPAYSTQKPWVKEGMRWDWMEAKDYVRDGEGNIVHQGGYPVISDYNSCAGYTEPDWMWGLTNTINYKDFTLSFTIDGRVGGVIFSTMDQALWNSGAHIDSDNQWRYEEVVNGNKTFIGKGVKVVSGKAEYDAYGNITYDDRVFAPNDEVISYEAYMKYKNPYIGTKRWQNIFDGTYFKLRNLSVSYNLPKVYCDKLRIKGASIGVVGQNLLMWTKELRFSDPDVMTDNLNAPSMRYLGVNLKLDF